MGGTSFSGDRFSIPACVSQPGFQLPNFHRIHQVRKSKQLRRLQTTSEHDSPTSNQRTPSRGLKIMEHSPDQPPPEASDFGCRGVIAGGEWPGGSLAAESLGPWWKPSDSGNPLEVTTDPLPQSLCQLCQDIRGNEMDSRCKIQQLEPGTCGLCCILFVVLKIFLRECPETIEELEAWVYRGTGDPRPGGLEVYHVPFEGVSRTSGGMLISSNVHNMCIYDNGAEYGLADKCNGRH